MKKCTRGRGATLLGYQDAGDAATVLINGTMWWEFGRRTETYGRDKSMQADSTFSTRHFNHLSASVIPASATPSGVAGDQHPSHLPRALIHYLDVGLWDPCTVPCGPKAYPLPR